MNEKISLAPMVDRTDYNFRKFLRMINKDIQLYTEMITAPALIYGDKYRILALDEGENNTILQIAASNLEDLKQISSILKETRFKEINLNIGCPSDRVSNNMMGASLMAYPYLVKDMINILSENTGKVISVKNRIGIDGKGVLENDLKLVNYEDLLNFIDITNAKKYIIHARVAILKGLSPKENRTIPPLDYDIVYQVKKDRPKLCIDINGGIKTKEEILNHLNYVDGVMIGRMFYDNPMLANELNEKKKSYFDIVSDIFHYVKKLDENDKNIYSFLRHTQGFFYNTKYSKTWKRIVTNPKVKLIDLVEFLEIIR